MSKDSFVKGVLIGIIITLTTMLFMGFSSTSRGYSIAYPLYVKIVG